MHLINITAANSLHNKGDFMKALIKTQDVEMVCFETLMIGIAVCFYIVFSGLAGVQETLFNILK